MFVIYLLFYIMTSNLFHTVKQDLNLKNRANVVHYLLVIITITLLVVVYIKHIYKTWKFDYNFSNKMQIIKNSDLEELQELGSGTFGTVYLGKWRGTDVAIKRIKRRCFSGRSSEQERLVR